jgi:hypothetical protein
MRLGNQLSDEHGNLSFPVYRAAFCCFECVWVYGLEKALGGDQVEPFKSNGTLSIQKISELTVPVKR